MVYQLPIARALLTADSSLKSSEFVNISPNAATLDNRLAYMKQKEEAVARSKTINVLKRPQTRHSCRHCDVTSHPQFYGSRWCPDTMPLSFGDCSARQKIERHAKKAATKDTREPLANGTGYSFHRRCRFVVQYTNKVAFLPTHWIYCECDAMSRVTMYVNTMLAKQ